MGFLLRQIIGDVIPYSRFGGDLQSLIECSHGFVILIQVQIDFPETNSLSSAIGIQGSGFLQHWQGFRVLVLLDQCNSKAAMCLLVERVDLDLLVEPFDGFVVLPLPQVNATNILKSELVEGSYLDLFSESRDG